MNISNCDQISQSFLSELFSTKMDLVGPLQSIWVHACSFLCCLSPQAGESFASYSPLALYNRPQPCVMSVRELEQRQVNIQSVSLLSHTDKELE